MWHRLWAWATTPICQPDVIAVPATGALTDRVDAAHLRLLSALDEQSRHWPEDRNDQLIDLATEVIGILGLRVDGEPDVPVIPGPDEYWENPR